MDKSSRHGHRHYICHGKSHLEVDALELPLFQETSIYCYPVVGRELGVPVFPMYSLFHGEPVGATKVSQPSSSKGRHTFPTKIVNT